MVRIEGTPTDEGSAAGVDLGKAAKVMAFHSTSSPGTFHFTMKLEEPVMFKRFGGEVDLLCTCRGFQNHRKCWHIAVVGGEDADAE
ncbi:MAG: SWIM zinc finger family protein [Actinobacteria bacterium]|nr:SWIM zinc finger family protein [Actinomycetota bacterium]MCA1806360.1 SWIM zinc finger family protein [Actinomycetota bacterium]